MSPPEKDARAPLVDVHAHLVTPWCVEAVQAAGIDVPDGMPGWPSWSVEDHLALMDSCGIDRAVSCRSEAWTAITSEPSCRERQTTRSTGAGTSMPARWAHPAPPPHGSGTAR